MKTRHDFGRKEANYLIKDDFPLSLMQVKGKLSECFFAGEEHLKNFQGFASDLRVDFIGSIVNLPSSNKKNVSINKGNW